MTDAVRTISPIDGSLVAERPFATEAQTQAALARANAAQKEWRATPLEQRIAAVGKMVDRLVADKDAIAQEITLQMGRPIAHSPFEIDGMAARARHMMAIAPEALAEIRPEPALGPANLRLRREPLGVSFIISPWNYPMLTAINALAPALIAGNAAIFKPSAQTPLTGERFADALEGLTPDGLLTCLHLDRKAALDLISHGSLNQVSFTGSVANGRTVEVAAAGTFISSGMELGGKDAAYVRADADMQATVEGVVDGAFFNAGQSCCGVERIYVAREIYQEFVDAAAALTNEYVLGDPRDPSTTLGPVVGLDAAARIRSEIAGAIDDGARPLIAQDAFGADDGSSTYVAPQVLVDCRQDMAIVQEETFGPSVMIQAVDGDEDGIEKINDSRFGLTASIWTQDEDVAFAIADQLDVGTVYQNRCDALEPALAWTGVKETGRGVTLSQFGFDGFTRLKSFNFKSGAS
jgi:acyl-CoA reductase-like NAD-dependent aldehyde dehydrogenase